MTPSKTPFAGYEVLQALDPLSSDGYYFTRKNPVLADRLDQIGCVLHKHDAHAAMANPTAAMTLATASPGGAIPANQTIYVTYTLVDATGGETLPVAVQTIRTPVGYQAPNGGPTCAESAAAGSLLSGNYSYAITVTDGAGGETTIGPSTQVTVPPGQAHSEVIISGLTALTNGASGGSTSAGWRLWRKQGAGPWYLIGTGAYSADGITDNGIAGDCTVAPPTSSTTAGANKLNVTVPSAGQPAGAVFINIYASLDGSFTSPALLATLPVADYDAVQTFTVINPSDGEPPPVSTCIPGANQINALTDIINLSRVALPSLAIAATVTANETAPINELIPVDASGGAVTIALPTGQTAGTLTAIMKKDATSNAVSYSGNVRGTAAVTESLGLQNSTVMLIADAAGSWWPIAGFRSLAALDARYQQKLLVPNDQGAAYTFALADAGAVVESTAAAAVTFTIPANATTAFPVGSWIEVCQIGAGQVTIAGAAGVTLDAPGGLVHTNGQYATIRLRKRATDEWVLSGNLA